MFYFTSCSISEISKINLVALSDLDLLPPLLHTFPSHPPFLSPGPLLLILIDVVSLH